MSASSFLIVVALLRAGVITKDKNTMENDLFKYGSWGFVVYPVNQLATAIQKGFLYRFTEIMEN